MLLIKFLRKGTNSPEEVTWYLFRIPVRQFESKFGNIDGFKSIKYARMLLTGFQDPVVLTLCQLPHGGKPLEKVYGQPSGWRVNH